VKKEIQMNLSGLWSYNEDFAFGKSTGKVIIRHNYNEVEAEFIFTEKVENHYNIEVVEKTRGQISERKIILESCEVKAIQNGHPIGYLPNTFEIQRITANKMVGSTFDTENVCGVFVMEKIKSL
jgi:hypothetical protein